MLEDREYMREPDYAPNNRWRSVTAILLIINVAVFLVQIVVTKAAPKFPLDDYFGLSLYGLKHGYIWQLLTFQFMHGGILHILLNSFGILTFGLAVEQFLGAKRFLTLYLLSGVAGGLLHVLGGLVWPQHFGVLVYGAEKIYVPMVGASAGLFGLIAAFATMFPHRDLTVYLFFVLPVTVSARVLMGTFAMVSIVGILIDKSNVAHGAHAGGLLAGWLIVRYMMKKESEPEDDPPVVTRKKPVKQETDFVSKEVDPILEKISAKGIHSLTESERKTLEAARKKIEKQ